MVRTRVILAFLHIAILFAAIVSSWGWPAHSRLFVLTCSVPSILLLCLFVSGQLGQRAKSGPVSQLKHSLDSKGVSGKVSREEITFFAWIFGFGMAVWLLGFQVSAVLFTFLYLRFKGRESWKMSTVLTVLLGVLMIGVFGRLLHLSWPDSLLQIWLGF